jgi:predicted PurR-regulated permease PerM
VPKEQRSNASPRSTTLLTLGLVLTGLYFARVVFIPFALAVLLSFLLAPLVLRLRRWRIGRVPSVLLVVSLALAVVAVVSGLMAIQFADLARRMPEYQETIRAKLHSVRESSSGTINRLTRAVHEFSEELTPKVPAKQTPGEVQPVPVEIRRNAFSPLEAVRGILGSVISIGLTGGIVVVFVIFMLFQREDLRDRLIRLIGAGQIHLTTKALDDAAHRLSRYLIAQLALNVLFGVVAAVGLLLMGVPNPILWGALAVLLRYVPYLGIWVAALMPAAVSLATSPSWLEPIGIFVLYFGIDLLVINFLEPLVYGGSTGISPMAILVAAIFWTWLWGPIGLLLSTPLTVCVVVIGHYVPSLEFLSILLSDQPVLTPEKRFYQRLLAMDIEEATDIAQEFLCEKKTLEKLYDEVIIPAFVLAEEDRHRGRMDDEHQQYITENARLVVEDIAERADEILAGGNVARTAVPAQSERMDEGETEPCVLAIPARDDIDEISALMLAHLLNRKGIVTRTVAAGLLSERLEVVTQARVPIVCVMAVPPLGYLHARYVARRLRQQLPEAKVIVAVLNQGDPNLMRQRQPTIPADEIVTSLQQAMAAVTALAPCTREQPEQTAFSS